MSGFCTKGNDALVYSSEERDMLQLMGKLNQNHLFADWDPAGTNDDLKHAMLSQLIKLHADYAPQGGLPAYVTRARALLEQSKANVNSLEGWLPENPVS